ncbi:thiamine diphosphate-binding protein [Lophiostoma macrostomum CBS 122681]|uniref:Thiamine diphosphate-binding protein n=1 Tax=Lophiostoma macrostomum CBS 122681 TaxID=1314788 RepID=A0A6A6TC02_9PLEO|nr:thiamine diphosphate-binding protein [Lophiostoma macrostomum CBS 122681]
MASSTEYTTAFALFEALWEAGVKNCFVNLGSDHPSIIEAIIKGKRERPDQWPRIITCPSEITAISMAHGYARIIDQPQAVIVHVDVGTQALAHGLHNASIGRAPVFIFAGLCPFTEAGELPGSRTEYMHWLQEAPDQKTIVRQYCRYTGEIRTGKNIKQMVARACQLASSAPKGPVYLASPRETLAEYIEPYSIPQDQWVPVGSGALPQEAVSEVANALVNAERPLVITGYSGRNHKCPEQLVQLAEMVKGLRIYDVLGSDVSFPFSHRAFVGHSLGIDDCTRDADFILLLDCDVPWIPSRNPPSKDAKIYHIDLDPLKQQISVYLFPAHGRWRADSYGALTQITQYIRQDVSLQVSLQDGKYQARWNHLQDTRTSTLQEIAALPNLLDDAPLTIHNIGSLLRSSLPGHTTFVVEVSSNSRPLFNQLQCDRPGSWINGGSTGIGWSNGAVLGVKLALQDQAKDSDEEDKSVYNGLVCQVVGDGCFMCSAPSSAAWVARKYEVPVLTVVLNNGGWKAPRNSTALVYPDGLNKTATDEELNISFNPSPDYAALVEAAAGSGSGKVSGGWMKGVRVATVQQLRKELEDAARRVEIDGKGVLVEALMEGRE